MLVCETGPEDRVCSSGQEPPHTIEYQTQQVGATTSWARTPEKTRGPVRRKFGADVAHAALQTAEAMREHREPHLRCTGWQL